MFIAGRAIEGSSSVPARRKIRCGRISAWLVMGVPQVEQNPRCRTFPESATDVNVFSSPVNATDFVSNATFTVDDPAPIYWHRRHQHWRVTMGSALAE
jgi:hypothetical protein